MYAGRAGGVLGLSAVALCEEGAEADAAGFSVVVVVEGGTDVDVCSAAGCGGGGSSAPPQLAARRAATSTIRNDGVMRFLLNEVRELDFEND